MVDVGRIGVWSGQLRAAESSEGADAAAELDELGYGAIWMPGGPRDGLEERLSAYLAATKRTAVATGILSIWLHPAPEAAALYSRLANDYPGRFVLGVGVSHPQRVGENYRQPLTMMRRYLDQLDAADVPMSDRVVAALGPRMLELARDRALGAHPYLVTPEHTRLARQILGEGVLLAPEQKVVLDGDSARARARAREGVARYLGLSNYTDNLIRLGFGPADIEHGGSDRLVDQLVAFRSVEAVVRRVEEHRAAGADHVALNVLGDPALLPREQWRELAHALTS
jgi:probable F420-dependent oxidoreductase